VKISTERARDELRRETAEIAVSVSERALREAIDEERQAALVDAFIADIERIAGEQSGSAES
jgi:F0F1-type ATP synthase membrane subunit b/b'